MKINLTSGQGETQWNTVMLSMTEGASWIISISLCAFEYENVQSHAEFMEERAVL